MGLDANSIVLVFVIYSRVVKCFVMKFASSHMLRLLVSLTHNIAVVVATATATNATLSCFFC